MGAQSCNREVAEPSAAEGKTHAEETIYKEGNVEMPVSENLVFDAAGENQLKALNATVNASASAGANSRHTVTYEQKIPVVCIVRSDQNDPITYVDNVEIIRQSNGTYKFAKDRIHLAQGSTLAPGKKWYLMVVTQNSFNKSTGELSVNATGAPEDLSPSATRVMDIPSASPWVELPTFPNGQPKWSKDWDTARKKQKLTLYAQGVLCRATLRLDDAYKAKLGGDNVDLKITQLKVVSTALSFSGKFKFDRNSLPPLTETSGRPTLTWVPTQTPSATKEYRALDANTPEYQKIFNAPNGVLQVSGSGSLATIFTDSNNPTRVDKTNLPQGVQSIIFWAVPVKGATNRHTTLIAETGSSSSAKVLQPSHTYIYGKKHTKDAGQGSAVYFDAVYYNPYTPLDYMAEYNMVRQWPNQFRPGGYIPQVPTNQFDTSHGVNSYTFLPWWDVEKTSMNSGGRHYSNPNSLQWSSIIPYLNSAAINTLDASPVNNVDVDAQVGTVRGWTKFSSRKNPQANVRYALALTNLGGSQKYRTAYRYEMVYGDKKDISTPYLELRKEAIVKNIERRQPPYIKDRNTFESQNVAFATFQWLVMKIEAVQLGAGFVGTVDDIADEEFWTNTPNQRKEIRLLPSNYTAYRAYLFPSYIDPSVGRKVREDLYRGYDVAWGASYEARPDEPTAFYLGDDYLAIFDAPKGRWGATSMRNNPRYVGIRFPVRPFTTKER
ncbi:MAG: hypothetical protein D8B41_04950 [Porphyromonas sp.]|nr:MAG: hypothetical protein D8B41_04950 [Porphyromonas sp.]